MQAWCPMELMIWISKNIYFPSQCFCFHFKWPRVEITHEGFKYWSRFNHTIFVDGTIFLYCHSNQCIWEKQTTFYQACKSGRKTRPNFYLGQMSSHHLNKFDRPPVHIYQNSDSKCSQFWCRKNANVFYHVWAWRHLCNDLIKKKNKRPTGHNSLTWVKRPLQICRWHATFFQYCQILKLMTRQWLKQFLRHLAYKVKMLKLSKRHKWKKVQIFFSSHLVHLLILSFKGFFFSSIFSFGNHFVQQSRTILAILAKGHKRNIDVKLFWNLATGHGDVV